MAEGVDIHIVPKRPITAEQAREIAREEIASLAGLVLRRLGGLGSQAPDIHGERVFASVRSVFGEALRDFSQTTGEPGPEPPTHGDNREADD